MVKAGEACGEGRGRLSCELPAHIFCERQPDVDTFGERWRTSLVLWSLELDSRHRPGFFTSSIRQKKKV